MEVLEFLTLVVPFLVIFYLAILLFIRPTKRALLNSLLGGVIAGLINMLVDIGAYYAHWWHYTFKAVTLQGATPVYLVPVLNTLSGVQSSLHVSLPFYLSTILIFGSAGYLLIWRFWQGRSRWLSFVFLIGIPLFCIVRDILGGIADTSYQVWENTALASIATIVMWLVAFYVGWLVFWRLTPTREVVVEGNEHAMLIDNTHAHAE